VLATDIKVPSLFAEPKKLIDVDEATELISAPSCRRWMRANCARSSPRRRDHLAQAPRSRPEAAGTNLQARPARRRLPDGKQARLSERGDGQPCARLGDIDNQGIAGIEKYIDNKRGLTDLQALGYVASSEDLTPLRLSIDLRAQNVMRDELVQGMEHFKAKAAAGAIMDVNTAR